jgi:hypothetical protein
MFFLCVCSLLY